MKFTESKDGKLRATFHISIRLGKAEVETIKFHLKRNGDKSTVKQALYCCLECGIEDLFESDEEAQEIRAGIRKY